MQELRDRRAALGRQLVSEYGRPEGRRPPGSLPALQQAAEALDRELDAASERLRSAFPQYLQLAAPDPIDLGEVRRLLRTDEALQSFMTLDKQVLVWLVRPSGSWYAAPAITRADLTALVGRVRTSLDQRQNPDLGGARFTPFDAAGAHELYRRLLAPFGAQLAGVRHLIVVPDDVLLPIPFGALVTSADGEAYRRLADLHARRVVLEHDDLVEYPKLAWLARDYAVTALPSATALRALRGLARASAADREPFIGFGDPALAGTGRDRGGVMLAARDVGVALTSVRSMNRLPATRDELLAIARALGADPARSLFLGDQATKPNVLGLDASGRLGRARVLAFATHGLLGGEVTGLKQPALVLTPPAGDQLGAQGVAHPGERLRLRPVTRSADPLSPGATGGSSGRAAHVAAGAGEARDEPVGHRVLEMQEHHRDAGGRGLRRAHRLLLEGDDQVDRIAGELLRGRVGGGLVGEVLEVEPDGPALLIPERAQALAERGERRRHMVEPDVQEADAPDLSRLLRLDAERDAEEDGGDDRDDRHTRGEGHIDLPDELGHRARTAAISGCQQAITASAETTSPKNWSMLSRVASCWDWL